MSLQDLIAAEFPTAAEPTPGTKPDATVPPGGNLKSLIDDEFSGAPPKPEPPGLLSRAAEAVTSAVTAIPKAIATGFKSVGPAVAPDAAKPPTDVAIPQAPGAQELKATGRSASVIPEPVEPPKPVPIKLGPVPGLAPVVEEAGKAPLLERIAGASPGATLPVPERPAPGGMLGRAAAKAGLVEPEAAKRRAAEAEMEASSVMTKPEGVDPGWWQVQQDIRQTRRILNALPNQFANRVLLGIPNAIKDTFGFDSPQARAPQSTAEAMTGATGDLAGFIVGPAKAAHAMLASNIGKALAPAAGNAIGITIAKNVANDAATLAVASGIAHAGEEITSESMKDAFHLLGEHVKGGAVLGAAFGGLGSAIPANTLAQRAARLGVGLGVLDVVQGTSPSDDRSLSQKMYDYGLNIYFLWNGKDPRAMQQSLEAAAEAKGKGTTPEDVLKSVLDKARERADAVKEQPEVPGQPAPDPVADLNALFAEATAPLKSAAEVAAEKTGGPIIPAAPAAAAGPSPDILLAGGPRPTARPAGPVAKPGLILPRGGTPAGPIRLLDMTGKPLEIPAEVVDGLESAQDKATARAQGLSRPEPGTPQAVAGRHAPVEFQGFQERGRGRASMELWGLTEDIPGTQYVKGSTVGRSTLENLGLTVPPAPGATVPADSVKLADRPVTGLTFKDFAEVSGKKWPLTAQDPDYVRLRHEFADMKKGLYEARPTGAGPWAVINRKTGEEVDHLPSGAKAQLEANRLNGVVTLDAWRNAMIPSVMRMHLPERPKADLSAKPTHEAKPEPGTAAARQHEAETAALEGKPASAEPPAAAQTTAKPAEVKVAGKEREITEVASRQGSGGELPGGQSGQKPYEKLTPTALQSARDRAVKIPDTDLEVLDSTGMHNLPQAAERPYVAALAKSLREAVRVLGGRLVGFDLRVEGPTQQNPGLGHLLGYNSAGDVYLNPHAHYLESLRSRPGLSDIRRVHDVAKSLAETTIWETLRTTYNAEFFRRNRIDGETVGVNSPEAHQFLRGQVATRLRDSTIRQQMHALRSQIRGILTEGTTYADLARDSAELERAERAHRDVGRPDLGREGVLPQRLGGDPSLVPGPGTPQEPPAFLGASGEGVPGVGSEGPVLSSPAGPTGGREQAAPTPAPAIRAGRPATDQPIARRQEGDQFERLPAEARKKLVDYGRTILDEGKTDFASWAKAIRDKVPGAAGSLPGAWAELMQEQARTQAKKPAEGKTPPPQMARETAAPLEPPSGMTEPQLKLGLHKDVVDAAGELFKAGKLERDPTMLISDQILEAIRDGKLRIEDMADILDRRGMTFAEFGAQMFRPAITDAAKRLGALGQLQRRLNELESDLKRDAAAPPKGGKGGGPGEPDPAKLKTIGDILDAARVLDPRGDRLRNRTMMNALSYWRRADNVRRGLLVTQLATSVRNFTSQVGRLGIDVLDQGLQGGLQRAFGKEVTQHPVDGMRAMMEVFARRPAEAKARVDALLEGLPREEERLFSNYASDLNRVAKKQGAEKHLDAGLRGAERAVDVLNTFNKFQEYAVRRAVFQTELAARLRRRGINLEDAIKDQAVRREVPVADIRAAIEKALEITFASNPAYGSAGYHFVKWINRAPGATFLIPFPRFMLNALKFYLEFSPAGFLKFLSEAERQKFRQGDMKTMSRGLLGMGLLSAAYLIRSMQGDDTKWNEVRLPGMERTIDTRPLNPFASYLFVADILRRVANGNLYGGGLATEAVKNILGVNVRGGTGLQAVDQLVDGLRDIGDARALTKYLQGAGGHLIAGLLTPLQQLTDVYAEFDPEAQIMRNVKENPFTGPIKQRFPSTMVEALGGDIGPEKASPTSSEPMTRESPGVRQVTGLTLNKEKNDFEKELDRLQIPYREVLPSQGDPRLDNIMAKHMGPLAEEVGSRIVNGSRYQGLGEVGKRLELKAYLQRLRKQAKAKAVQDTEYREIAREVKAGVSKERLKEMAREEKAGLR